MYIEVCIDINHRAVDRLFTYAVPENLEASVVPGVRVRVPFGRGNSEREALVIRILKQPEIDETRIKFITGIQEKGTTLDENLIQLAIQIRNRYGGTFYQSLSIVLPDKEKVTAKKKKYYQFIGTQEVLLKELEEAGKKKYYARERLLMAFQKNRIIPQNIAAEKLHITANTVKCFEDKGILRVFEEEKSLFKNTDGVRNLLPSEKLHLTEEQKICVDGIENSEKRLHLIYGVTGSGKTEIYLQLIEKVISEGKEAIVLIPEISLTYQTLMRFYDRFSENVTFVHSKISKGERYERFRSARDGKVKVMIGPRSALFTPFKNLGLIIIDEFHDGAYVSENMPKYSALEVAIMRSKLENSKVVFGSATPSVEYYRLAKEGKIELHTLKNRAVSGSFLPHVEIVDLRQELRNRNHSIFSEKLKEKMEETLNRGEQLMLFLNRRGYAGSVSCRECGKPLECPHCSVPLSLHRNHILKCHYCNYETTFTSECPSCHSKLIGAFGTGTEKVEKWVRELFPAARVLRMDADTTKGKDGHEKILEQFAAHDADILIGTQMIVKGHDFKDVTLVGILAADLSLNVPDYRSAEKTFQLLVQAEGRAGRREKSGECIIQTYLPENYAIASAKNQDFEKFYEEELKYRKSLSYPPFGYFMSMMISGPKDFEVHQVMREIYDEAEKELKGVLMFEPVEAGIYKLNDQYREQIYFKTKNGHDIYEARSILEQLAEKKIGNKKIFVTFDV